MANIFFVLNSMGLGFLSFATQSLQADTSPQVSFVSFLAWPSLVIMPQQGKGHVGS